jgi:hypothetical protein
MQSAGNQIKLWNKQGGEVLAVEALRIAALGAKLGALL